MPQKNLPPILIVDDDPNKRIYLKLFLERAFETETIIECKSGTEAIQYLLGHVASVVITDYKMGPINGLELTRWIRERSRFQPVIMVTGHPEIHAEALRAGVNFVFDVSQLEDLRAALQFSVGLQPLSPPLSRAAENNAGGPGIKDHS